MKFLNTEQHIKLAILAGTYAYFVIRYYICFNENPLSIINKENISVIGSFLSLKYISLQNSHKYQEFMEAKFYKTKETEKKWLLSLKKIPNGLMIYNLKDN